MRTVAFCEIDAGCRAALRRNWPSVPIFTDIRKLDASSIDADVVCGGFPCQPFSSASVGRKGIADDRWLWPEMLRVIQQCKPAWVCGENVTQLDGLALEQVVSDLEACGYEVAPPLEIPACAVGQDHWRARIWILGYADQYRKPRRAINDEASWVPWNRCERSGMAQEDGIPARLDELAAYGNAVVPQIPEIIGRAIMRAEGLTA